MKNKQIADILLASAIVIAVFAAACLVGWAIMPNIWLPIGMGLIVVTVLGWAIKEEFS